MQFLSFSVSRFPPFLLFSFSSFRSLPSHFLLPTFIFRVAFIHCIKNRKIVKAPKCKIMQKCKSGTSKLSKLSATSFTLSFTLSLTLCFCFACFVFCVFVFFVRPAGGPLRTVGFRNALAHSPSASACRAVQLHSQPHSLTHSLTASLTHSRTCIIHHTTGFGIHCFVF